MRSKEELMAEMNEAQRKINHLERMGEDVWPEGAIIYCEWDTNNATDRGRIAFLKHKGAWRRTGSSDAYPETTTWQSVVDFVYSMGLDVLVISTFPKDELNPYDLAKREYEIAKRRAEEAKLPKVESE